LTHVTVISHQCTHSLLR